MFACLLQFYRAAIVSMFVRQGSHTFYSTSADHRARLYNREGCDLLSE